jgi:predicted N-acetyltransferase YhbS
MISVCTSHPDSDQVAEFRTWVEAEWSNVDPFEGQNGRVLPAPVLASKDGALVGGLSFTYSSIPGTQDIALWINTLLVAPEHRRMGIGSKLISAAESAVADVGADELYVFTDVASIYQKLDWTIHSNSGKSTVLKKKFVRGQGRT